MKCLINLTILLGISFSLPAQEASGNDEEKAKSTIYVTNQSFEIPKIDLIVTVNDQVLANQEFRVHKQHTWVPFRPSYKLGMNSIRVASKDGQLCGSNGFQICWHSCECGSEFLEKQSR